MFKRRVEDSGKSTILGFACRIFYAHIANVLIMLVAGMLVENLSLLKIEVSDQVTPIVVTAVCFLFYVVYVYIHSWRAGQRDYNLVLYKHDVEKKYKALAASLLSQLPGLILVILVQVSREDFSWVRYARYYYLNFNYFLITVGENFRAIYFVPVLFAPLISVPAYRLGYKGIYLANKLIYRMPMQKKGRK